MHARSSRSVTRKSCPISSANFASAADVLVVPSTAALSRIARWTAGSWSTRAAMRARSVPGSSAASGQVAASAASSTRNSGLPPPRSTSASTPRSSGRPARGGEHAADQVEAVRALERAQGHLHDERPFDRRRPHHVRIGPLPRDEEERAVAQRTHDDGEVVAQHRVGPLQVVHPQHRHAGLGVAAQHLGDHCRQPVAGAGGVEAVELRRVAEQEEADVEEALSSASPGVNPQTSWARCSIVRRTVSALASRSSPKRPVRPVTTGAHTSCSPYGAQAVRTTIASASSASTISSASRSCRLRARR